MKNKLKSIAAPKTWGIRRKKNVWIMKPRGGHSTAYSLSVSTLLKFYLKHAKTAKEIRNILQKGEVLVDGRKISQPNYGVGVMDILEIPSIKEKYIITINRRGKIHPAKTDISFKLAKITSKMKRGKKTQLGLFGGKCLLVEKDSFKVGDTLVIEIKDSKIKEHIKFAEGASCLLLGGSHIGELGSVKKIEGDKITISGDSGNEFETLRKFLYVVGKEKPLFKITEK